jgi:hypothetical protein
LPSIHLVRAERGANRSGCRGSLRIVTVRTSRPGQIAAEEPVVVTAGHEVDMKVWHALADDVIDGYERSLRTHGLGYGSGQPLSEAKERPHAFDR